MKAKHIQMLLLFLTLLCLAGLAIAATPGGPAAPATPQTDLTVDDLHMTFLQGIMDWLKDPQQFVNQRMLDLGTHLFWAISFLYISFIGLKIMLDSSSVNEQMGVLINSMIPIGIIKFVLDFYIAPVPGIGMSIPIILNNGFDYIGATMLGLDVGVSMTNSVYAGLEAYMKIALILWNTFPLIGYNNGSFWGSLTSLMEAAAQYQVIIADFAVMCVAMLALVACAGLYIAIYVYSLCLFVVGLMLGPIMLPWKLLPPFSYLSDSWVKFMVMSGMFRITALAIIHINEIIAVGISNKMDAARALTVNAFGGQVKPSLGNAAIVATNIESMPLQHLVLSLAMLVVALLTLYMLTKIDHITGSLLSGSGSGGLSFGHGGMQTAVGAGGKTDSAGGSGSGSGAGAMGIGGGIGGSGMGSQLMSRVAAVAGGAGAAMKGGLQSTAGARTAAAVGSAAGHAGKEAGKAAFDAMPPNAQMAVAATAAAATNPNNAVGRAASAMKAAGNKMNSTPAGAAVRQATSAVTRGKEAAPSKTQTTKS